MDSTMLDASPGKDDAETHRASWSTLCNYQGLFEACLRSDPLCKQAMGASRCYFLHAHV